MNVEGDSLVDGDCHCILLPYCDGGSHSGNVAGTVKVSDDAVGRRASGAIPTIALALRFCILRSLVGDYLLLRYIFGVLRS